MIPRQQIGGHSQQYMAYMEYQGFEKTNQSPSLCKKILTGKPIICAEIILFFQTSRQDLLK